MEERARRYAVMGAMKQQTVVAIFGFAILHAASCTTQPDPKGNPKPGGVVIQPAADDKKVTPPFNKSELPRFIGQVDKMPKDMRQLAQAKVKFHYDEAKDAQILIRLWEKGLQGPNTTGQGFLLGLDREFRSGDEVKVEIQEGDHLGNKVYRIDLQASGPKSIAYELPGNLEHYVAKVPKEVDTRGQLAVDWFICIGKDCKPQEFESLEEMARRTDYAIVVRFTQTKKVK